MAQVTIADIARHMGLGKATVSRALNGHREVSAATRERVIAVARELGYRRQADLQGLAQRRWPQGEGAVTSRLAVVSGGARGMAEAEVALWRSEAEALGYELEVAYLREGGDDLLEQLDARGVGGLVLLNLEDDVPLPAGLDRFACLVVGHYRGELRFHRIERDLGAALRATLARAHERGYHRPGVVMLEHRSAAYNARIEDELLLARQRWRAATGDELPTFRYRGPDKPGNFLAWVAERELDLVVAEYERHWWQLRDGGFAVPEQVGAVQLHVDPTNGLDLTGFISIERRSKGTMLGFVHDLLRRGERGEPAHPWRIQVTSDWVEGSTMPPRAAGGRGSG